MSATMVAKKSTQNTSQDILIWSLVAAFTALGCIGLYAIDEKYAVFRVLMSMLGFAVLSFMSTYTSQGLELSKFLQTAYSEMRLVVWPKYDEVTKLSTVIVISVVVVSLILWFLDSTLTQIFSIFLG